MGRTHPPSDPGSGLVGFYERCLGWVRSPSSRRPAVDQRIIPVQVDLVGEAPAPESAHEALPEGTPSVPFGGGLATTEAAGSPTPWQFRETVLLRKSRRSSSLLLWTAIGATGAVTAWAFLAPLAETIAVQGKLEPGSSVQDIEAPVPGLVEAVLVEEGDTIRQGTPLIRFDLRDARSKLAAAEDVRNRLDNENRIFAATLGEPAALGSLSPNQRLQLESQADKQQSEQQAALEDLRKAQARLQGLSVSLANARNIESRFAGLVASGAASEVQLLEARNRAQDFSTQISETQREINRLRSVLDNTRSSSSVDLRSRIETNLKEISRLDGEIRQARLQIQYGLLSSPSDGIVFDIDVSPGSVVMAQAEPLMKVVPQDGLRARVYLPNTAIGFVQVGQSADLSIDAFDASDFGRIPARVERIGSDALTTEQQAEVLGTEATGLFFPAVLQLSQQKFNLGNDKSAPLKAGMSLTADIKIRERRFINILGSFFDNQRRNLERMR
ncbi:MAG: HlyD family efflux transporter periplasmic adaptor subunit [Synechococcaceae cyanobacterium MAG-AL1]|nr:HlyD family efflux transporter periplasmic adaptor subunit [Candidatus Regnicoccus frigidus MAG-AL1]